MLEKATHSRQKEFNHKLAVTRSNSTQRQRNPLLLSDNDALEIKRNRGLVPTYLDAEKRIAERPRGLAKGAFSNKGTGSFKLAYEEAPAHRPQRKFIPTVQTPDEKPKSKRIFDRRNSANPITQDDDRYEATPVRTRESTKNRSTLFSETAQKEEPISRTPREYIRISNRIFEDGGSDGLKMHKRRVQPSTKPLAGNLLKYEYALPYRDVPVTGKPAENSQLLEEFRLFPRN